MFGANNTELVVNGSFDTDTDWAKANFTIGSGVASYDGLALGYITPSVPVSFPVGSKVRVEFTVSNSASTARIALANESGSYLLKDVEYIDYSNGSHTIEAEILNTNTNWRFYGHQNNGSFDVDNISIKQIGCVLDLSRKGVAMTDWEDLSGNNHDGVATNSPLHFIDLEEWVESSCDATNYLEVDSNNKLRIVSDTGISVGIQRLDALIVGQKYKLKFTLSDITSGGVKIEETTNVLYSNLNTAISYELIFQATETGRIGIYRDGITDLKISDISLEPYIDQDAEVQGDTANFRQTNLPDAKELYSEDDIMVVGYKSGVQEREKGNGGIIKVEE